MKIFNNISAAPVFRALPFYYKGETVRREEIMARDAEYGKIIGQIIEANSDIDDFIEKDGVQDAIEVESEDIEPEDVEEETLPLPEVPSLEDIEALRSMTMMLIRMQNDNPKTETPPSSYGPSATLEKHVLDIKA